MATVPDRPPRSSARPSLPRSSPSPPPSSTADASSSFNHLADTPALSSTEDALGVALDGSFVETTSEAAARAVAQFYAGEHDALEGDTAATAGRAQRGTGQYGVQTRIDSRGRTVYRVRPIVTSPASSLTDAASTSSSPPSAHHPFARPSHHPQPSQPPQQQPTIALHRSSLLRTSRSIPLLRSRDADVERAHEQHAAGLHPSAASASARLRKAPSSPSLRGEARASLHEGGTVVQPARLVPTQRVRARSTAIGAGAGAGVGAGSGEGDVLGRILGWRVDVPAARSSASREDAQTGASGGTRRRVKSPAAGAAGPSASGGAARVGLPDMFRLGARKGSKGSRGQKLSGSAVSEAGTDRSDLPEDLDELDAVSVYDNSTPSSPSSSPVSPSSSPVVEEDHPFASPKQRPSYLRRPTGPFGTGVRIHRASPQPVAMPALVTPAPALAPATAPYALTHAMREVSSSDSMRTARADDPQPLLPPAPIDDCRSSPSPARRFEDPSIFDVFHRPFPSLPSSPSDSSPSRQPHAIPFGAHGRLPSSASLASSHSARSDHSHASATAHDITVVPAPGDDPRFVIWGVKEPPAPAAAATTSPRGAGGAGKGGRRPSFAPGTPRSAAGAGEQGSPPAQAASPGSARTRWSVGARSGSGTASTASAGASAASSPATSLRNSVASSASHATAQRVLMAATVERLVAELTSQIAPDLLADFFLTYRHYLAPLSLLCLLIARFEWSRPSSSTAPSSSPPPAPLSPEDDALRRVVRVRTFVVVRYWLLNHFMDDFYPDRALRTALTTWLNDSARDERFRQSPRDLRLIKGLKKTARRCKERYILGAAATAPGAPGPAVAHPHGPLEGEVDLDLGVGGGMHDAPTAATAPHAASSSGFASLRSRAGLSATPHHHHDASSSSSAAASAALDSAAAASTEHDAHGHGGAGPGGALARGVSTALGTLGRFRRKLKERAATAAHAHDAATGGVGGVRGGERAELELEKRGETDLLWVRGGVDAYLRYWGVEVPQDGPVEEGGEEMNERTPDMVHGEEEEGTPSTADEGAEALTPRPVDAPPEPALDGSLALDASPVLADEGVGLGLGIVGDGLDEPPAVLALDHAYPSSSKPPLVAPPADVPALPSTTEPYVFSLAPGAFTSLDAAPPSFPLSNPSPLRPESVRIELDDLDDSDDDMDDDVIEAKRTLKRLPAATNLRLAAAGVQQRRSPSAGSEASSYGFAAPHGHGGFDWSLGGGGVGGEDDGASRESISFLDDEAGSTLSAAAVIPNFVLDGLFDSDDDDEPGDVEAALRRLEGLVDESREDEKKKRVERQMEKSGKLGEERRGEIDRLEKEVQRLDAEYADMRRMSAPSTNEPDSAAVAPVPPQREMAIVDVAPTHVEVGPLDLATNAPAPVALSSSPTQIDQSTTGPDLLTISPPTATATTVDTLRKPSLSHIFGIPLRPLSARPGLPTSFTLPLHPHRGPSPPTHRSFVLSCRTDVLAAQFTLIERDLLRMLSYQELVSGSWRERTGAVDGERGVGGAAAETDVCDWEAYVKERRRRDFEEAREGRTVARTSAVQDVIVRFNLTANWVCSEILLTADVHERAMLIAKFIRLAFKCYCQGNLQTLAQIVHGLQLDDVERLNKTWARVPAWEMRKFRGMQAFASHLRNFKHLRALMSAMVEEYGGSADDDGASSSSSPRPSTSPSSGKGCIPFLGLFLRDLALTTELPTYLDPSSPSSPAHVSPSGLLVSLASPSSFSHLPSLPPSTPFAPLVNVHKFRLLAGIVGRVVTFQRLAARYAHEPTRGAYWRCLKIRCLDVGVARELSRRLEP
ncbi:uncharacterized protein RHOBADRAFT_56170 [Rhodotorula graminis WP1]|uniref:Ras GEF n=1 Tax=Rhodotorula graminis (strain WP1) TaxID=578459 RepID=A0A0P9GX73_RHOGW|nr:uncharacterized protein RHOBADRAFT_56170 [Rhodotorula graminis WP1]KPV72035.1 hypothetical protein RHOBADRAFT_56170 [Rhodotorula graminis WP1]